MDGSNEGASAGAAGAGWAAVTASQQAAAAARGGRQAQEAYRREQEALRAAKRQRGAAAAPIAAPTELKLLTWNVWFDKTRINSRSSRVFELLRLYDADVVCLQEVTPKFVELLLSQPWACERYAFSTTDCSEPPWESNTLAGGVSPYGVLMLVAKEFCPAFFVLPLPTDMDRTLLLADFRPANEAAAESEAGAVPGAPPPLNMLIGTVHLESMAARSTRAEQLGVCAAALKERAPWGARPSILAGDFNFDSRRNWSDAYTNAADGTASAAAAPGAAPGGISDEEGDTTPSPRGWVEREELEEPVLAQTLPRHRDLWAHLRGDDEMGWTFDSEENPLVRGYEQMRYDRVLACLGEQQVGEGGAGGESAAGQGWEAVSIELVGTGTGVGGVERDDAEDEDGEVPSDHFGLLVTLRRSAAR